MKTKQFQKNDEQILIESLKLVDQAMQNGTFDESVMKQGAAHIKAGWSWINCCQWLSGAKSLDALAKIPEADFFKIVGFDQQHAVGIIYAVSAMCKQLNISQGENFERLTKLFDDELIKRTKPLSQTRH